MKTIRLTLTAALNLMRSCRLACLGSIGVYLTLPCIRASSTVDVMIVYTTAVEEVYSGQDGVRARALNAIHQANLSFEKSEIDLNVELVHLAKVNYVEDTNDIENDLDRLTEGSGEFGSVHDLRNEFGADLVCLFRSGEVDGASGIAWVLDEADGFPEAGFSVVVAERVNIDYLFAHELGHNFGAAHDRDNATTGGLFPYSYGYRFDTSYGSEVRTLMSYAPGWIFGQFSNPNIEYDGRPSGKAGSEDNARTLNETSGVVAEYRAHKNRPPVASVESSQRRQGNDFDGDGFESIRLDGSASTGVDSDIVSWSWSWAGGSIDGEVVDGLIPLGITEVTLTVTDGNGLSGVDSLVIAIAENIAPTVYYATQEHHGYDYDGDGFGTFFLRPDGYSDDGSRSDLSFEWKWYGEVTHSENISGEFPIGTTEVTLTVIDKGGLSNSVSFLVTVEAQLPLIADAGPDEVIYASGPLRGAAVAVYYPTNPGDGSEGRWEWSGYQYQNYMYYLIPEGTVVQTLTVTRGDQTATDERVLTVLRRPNVAPIADAGPDLYYADLDGDGYEEVTLRANGSEDYYGIEEYIWTWNEGSANGVEAKVRLPVGSSSVDLIVSDEDGEEGRDSITVIVDPMPIVENRIEIVDPVRKYAFKGLFDDIATTQFSVTVLAGEEFIKAYHWIAQDSIGIGKEVEMQFLPGIHSITLDITVEDGMHVLRTFELYVGQDIDEQDDLSQYFTAQEMRYMSVHPHIEDTDGDGIENMTEVKLGLNPADPESRLHTRFFKLKSKSYLEISNLIEPAFIRFWRSKNLISWNPVIPLDINGDKESKLWTFELPSDEPEYFKITGMPLNWDN